MHPVIAYVLLALVILAMVGGLVVWRRSQNGRSDNRSFRHTFDDSAPRR